MLSKIGVDNLYRRKAMAEKKFCADCRYFFNNWGYPSCKHDSIVEYDAVTKEKSFGICYRERQSYGKCGEGARFFEQNVSLWSRLTKLFIGSK
jgi:hypothetical protein